MTEDGFLLDGHQRLKALAALGRKRISAKHVRVVPKVNRDNMLDYAITSNTVRRMQTTADKADRMHKLAAIGWSQRRIAKAFGTSQPAVSQLMNTYPPADGTPEVVITEGEDGKTYSRVPRGPQPKVHPWALNGVATKSLRKTRKLIAMELPAGLAEYKKATLDDELDGLVAAIEDFQRNMREL